ncbi:MAG: DsbA family protein [Cytophagales bacterium]|nr:DsbA family protein [Cytophagales bacterium]
MTEEKSNLLCDTTTGICEIPVVNEESNQNISQTSISQNQIKIVYFTDPICSSCWGIEPQLRKLKLEYGHAIEVEYRMGGLLPDWSYNSGGISKPSDVASHWDEVSHHYDMPIDGDVWLEDPLDSSYPPSIGFKAAQLQGQDKALLFLREIREMVFLKKTNIAKRENLELAAQKVGLDLKQFTADLDTKALQLFQEDLQTARAYGVRGFPTLFIIDSSGNKNKIYGARPYSEIEKTLQQANSSLQKKEYSKDWQSIFDKYPTLTAREYSEIGNIERKSAESELNKLVNAGKLQKLTTKNGALWSK